MYLRELRISYAPRSDLPSVNDHAVVNSARDALSILRPILEHEPVEVFGLLCLTTKLHLIAYHELSRGTLDATLVHPRDVFQVAFLTNAAVLILGHNHPSGDPTPSPDDLVLTQRLVAAGELLGVDVLDHIILGDQTYYSFKEHGHL